MHVGILVGDEPVDTSPREHLDKLLRQVESAQRNGFDHIVIGQHFLYEGLRWLQPIPTLARIAAETDAHVRVGSQIIVAPLYEPLILAEELATLDVVTEGRLVIGLGVGYRQHEYANVGVPFEERTARFEELVSVMRQIWTQEEIDHQGEYYTVRGKRHVAPIQTPHPPLWIGAQSRGGVRRAARIGGTWAITPQVELPDAHRLIRVFASECDSVGGALGSFPLRRELSFGKDRADALDRFGDVARDRYLAYAARDMAAIPEEQLRNEFADVVQGHAVLGTPEEVAQQLVDIASELPVDPILVRPHWPGMSPEQVDEFLDTCGSFVVPALREVQPLDPKSYINAQEGEAQV